METHGENCVNHRNRGYHPLDLPECFCKMRAEDQATLLRWIDENIEEASRRGEGTSYGWKHFFEFETGLYITNGEFKGAMLAAGYKPVDPDELNWRFKKTRVKNYYARQGI